MKYRNQAYFLSAILMMAVFSVGFKYETRELLQPVNMYLCADRLYVSDAAFGIRIYSVADKGNPVFITQVPLAGNTGLAVSDSIVYANSYDAIIALRIHTDGSVDTAKIIRQTMYDCMPVYDRGSSGPFSCGCTPPVAYENKATGTGSGGSYAVFAVIDTFLYYIDRSSLITMSIAESDNPIQLSTVYIDWSVETLFPSERYLFIGGTTGMYIMDRSNPANPAMIGSVAHFRAYDPVVVRDTMAYVTLRNGNTNGGTRDALLAVSIADPTRPFVVREENATTPYGLALSDTLLYVSNGYRGYTLYSVSQVDTFTTLASFPMHETKDFIWDGTTLYIMTFQGIEIMNVADPRNPVKTAFID